MTGSAFLLETTLEADFIAALRANSGPSAALPPDPRLRLACDIIANARTTLNLRIWGSERTCAETSIVFRDTIASGGGVMLNPRSASQTTLSAFVDGETIPAMIAPLLPPEPPAFPPFVLQIPSAEMIVIMAMLDMAAADILRKRVVRISDGLEPPKSLHAECEAHRAGAVAGWIAEWWGVSSFAHLLTYGITLGGQPMPPDGLSVAASQARLANAGVLTGDSKSGFRLSDSLMGLLPSILGLSAGFQWQRIARIDDEHLLISERIFLFGAMGRILEATAPSPGMLRLALCSRKSVVDFIAGECVGETLAPEGPPAKPAAATPLTSPAKRFCGQCGARLAAQARFCGQCGASL